MRIAIVCALMLLAGCSGSDRDEDAYLDAAFDRADTAELMAHTADEFVEAGDIACGLNEAGNSQPDGASILTGISWTTVWEPALEHLCP